MSEQILILQTGYFYNQLLWIAPVNIENGWYYYPVCIANISKMDIDNDAIVSACIIYTKPSYKCLIKHWIQPSF